MVFLHSTRNHKAYPTMPKVLNSILWYIFLNNLHVLQKGKNIFLQYTFVWITLGAHIQTFKINGSSLWNCATVVPLLHWRLLLSLETVKCHSRPSSVQPWISHYYFKWKVKHEHELRGFHSQKVPNAKCWMIFKIVQEWYQEICNQWKENVHIPWTKTLNFLYEKHQIPHCGFTWVFRSTPPSLNPLCVRVPSLIKISGWHLRRNDVWSWPLTSMRTYGYTQFF